MQDNGGRITKLNEAEFTDMDSLSRDSALEIAAWGVRKGSNSSFVWLTVTCTKRWSIASKLDMQDLTWFNIKQEIIRP